MLSTRRPAALIWIALLVVSMFARSLPGSEDVPVRAYQDTLDRIDELSNIRGLSVQKRAERVSQLEKLGHGIERTWRARDAATYARLTLKLCQALGSRKFGTDRQYGLAQSFAMRALDKGGKIQLRLQCGLLRYVQTSIDGSGRALKGQAKARLRKQRVSLWLHAWQRLEETIDKNWDPKKMSPDERFTINVIPPAATGLPGGVSPKVIKDPKLRAEYEAAIAANKKKAEEYNRQHGARKLKKYWLPGAERAIMLAYIRPPAAKAELEGLLRKYVSDPAARGRILKAVEKGEMPEIRRRTTQPVKGKTPAAPEGGREGKAGEKGVGL